MKLAIMQPYFFPYLGYFQLINVVDKFIFYDDVNYINKGWINRNNILINEKASLFSIPLKEVSQNKLIKDIDTANDTNYRVKFLRTIEMSYKKALYFKDVFPLIGDVLQNKETYINQLAQLSIRTVSTYLQLSTLFVHTSSVYDNQDLKAQFRILDICRQENANHYINPIGGREIYSKELFEEARVKLNFIRTKSYSYQQFNNEFVPNLSIIDVLMFNSREEVIEMLGLYELV